MKAQPLREDSIVVNPNYRDQFICIYYPRKVE
jgi:hypothetical protein